MNVETTFWEHLPRPIMGLSPMDGVTDAPFRVTVARQGRPDVSFTEFTSVGDICRGPDHLLASLLYCELERPVVAQLYGKDPDLFYQAVHAACELGFDGVDINMGCPSRNVASSGSGAGLIRTPDRARAIMRTTRQAIFDWANGQTLEAVGFKASRIELIRGMNLRRAGQPMVPRRCIPLSVKTRLGYDSIVIEQWIGHLLEEGPVAICVHGRTLEQMYRGEADWEAIGRAARLVRGTKTLLLGNGDLRSLADAVHRIRESGVQGVLLGRAALGEPWLFRNKDQARNYALQTDLQDSWGCAGTDSDNRLVGLQERFQVMLEHARAFEAILGVERFPRMRKHLGWYCKGFPHAAAMRAHMVRARSRADVQHLVAAYLKDASIESPLGHQAPEGSGRPPVPALACGDAAVPQSLA